MKKVSLIITAVALTVGVSNAFASNHKSAKSSNVNTIYRYTNGSGVVLVTATRPTAQTLTGCTGETELCGKAWTTAITPVRESAFDIFHAD